MIATHSRQIEELYRENYRSIFYFFAGKKLAGRRLTREECRDLTQETFSRALRGIEGFRNQSSLRTWLFKIAKNTWLNRDRDLLAVKRSALEVSLSDPGGDEDDGEDLSEVDGEIDLSPESALLQAERATLVRKALAKLPRQRQRCLALRLEEFKYREIADLLDISIQSVKAHLYQARDQLRELLEDDFGDTPTGAGKESI